jgi:hypothetical protein
VLRFLARSTPRLQHQPRLFKLLLQHFRIRQHGFVIRCHDLVGQSVQCVACQDVAFVGAQDQAYGWVFVRQCPVFFGVVAVHVHLAYVGVGEAAEFQVYDDQAAQAALKEPQIHAILGLVDAQTPSAQF